MKVNNNWTLEVSAMELDTQEILPSVPVQCEAHGCGFSVL